jgi:hypothetical protein
MFSISRWIRKLPSIEQNQNTTASQLLEGQKFTKPTFLFFSHLVFQEPDSGSYRWQE